MRSNCSPWLKQNSVLVIFAINNIFRFILFTKLYSSIFFQFEFLNFQYFSFKFLLLKVSKFTLLWFWKSWRNWRSRRVFKVNVKIYSSYFFKYSERGRTGDIWPQGTYRRRTLDFQDNGVACMKPHIPFRFEKGITSNDVDSPWIWS